MLNRWLAVLIAVATVAFAVGVSLENDDTHRESSEAAAHSEAAESAEAAEAGESQGVSGDESEDETLMGVDLESTPFVVLAVVAALAFAAAAWLRPNLTALLTLVGLAMLAFAALDVREVFHQADESNGGLATLAALVAVLHGASAWLAFRLSEGVEPA